MKATGKYKRIQTRPKGSVLALILIITLILVLVGYAIIKIAEGTAVQTILFQNESIAMSGNPDLLLDMDVSGTSGTITFPNSRADYKVEFYGFVGYRPVFEVTADGYCGTYHRSIRVYVTQAVSGWEMGMCQVPSSTTTTTPVYFVDGEIVDIPIHINTYDNPKDSDRDIFISGSPTFLESVSMGESRYSSGGADKYQTVMGVFKGFIYFDQPKSLISD
jgi:hypothetical protein